MAKKPFPFSVCAECCGSGTDGYSKTEVDSKLRVINDELQRLDANVRDISLNVYTKADIDSKIKSSQTETLAFVDTKISEFNTHIFTNYAEKKDVYTKTEIDNMLGAIDTALDNIIAIQNELIGGDSV